MKQDGLRSYVILRKIVLTLLIGHIGHMAIHV